MKSSKNNDFACKIDINFKEKRTNLFHYAFVGVLLNFCHNFIGESEGLLYKITPASIFLTLSSTDVSDQGCKTKKPIKWCSTSYEKYRKFSYKQAYVLNLNVIKKYKGTGWYVNYILSRKQLDNNPSFSSKYWYLNSGDISSSVKIIECRSPLCLFKTVIDFLIHLKCVKKNIDIFCILLKNYYAHVLYLFYHEGFIGLLGINLVWYLQNVYRKGSYARTLTF